MPSRLGGGSETFLHSAMIASVQSHQAKQELAWVSMLAVYWPRTMTFGFTPVLPTRTVVRAGLASGLQEFRVPVSSKPYACSTPKPKERRLPLNTPKRVIAANLPFNPPGDAVRITNVPPDVTPAGAAQGGIRPGPGETSRAVAIGSFLMAWLVVGLLWELLAAKGIFNGRVLGPPSSFLPYLMHGPGAAGIGYNKVTFDTAILATGMRVMAGVLFAPGGGLLGGPPLL